MTRCQDTQLHHPATTTMPLSSHSPQPQLHPPISIRTPHYLANIFSMLSFDLHYFRSDHETWEATSAS